MAGYNLETIPEMIGLFIPQFFCQSPFSPGTLWVEYTFLPRGQWDVRRGLSVLARLFLPASVPCIHCNKSSPHVATSPRMRKTQGSSDTDLLPYPELSTLTH